jgi:hypothetical protein
MIMSAPDGVTLITILDIRSIATSEEPITVVNIETVSIDSGKKENIAKKLMDALSVKQLSAAKLRMLSFKTLAPILSIPISKLPVAYRLAQLAPGINQKGPVDRQRCLFRRLSLVLEIRLSLWYTAT